MLKTSKRLLIPENGYSYYLSDSTILRISRSLSLANYDPKSETISSIYHYLDPILTIDNPSILADLENYGVNVLENGIKYDVYNIERQESWSLDLIIDGGFIEVNLMTLQGNEGYIVREIAKLIESAISIKIEETGIQAPSNQTVISSSSHNLTSNSDRDDWEEIEKINEIIDMYEQKFPQGNLDLTKKIEKANVFFKMKRNNRLEKYWPLLAVAIPFLIIIYLITGSAFFEVTQDVGLDIESVFITLLFSFFVFAIHISAIVVIVAILSPYFFRPEFYVFTPSKVLKYRQIWINRKITWEIPWNEAIISIRQLIDDIDIHVYTVEFIGETQIIELPYLYTYSEAVMIKQIFESMYPPPKSKIVIP